MKKHKTPPTYYQSVISRLYPEIINISPELFNYRPQDSKTSCEIGQVFFLKFWLNIFVVGLRREQYISILCTIQLKRGVFMIKKILGPVLLTFMLLASVQVFAGAFYRITGMIDIVDGNVVLTTDDCRVFTLKISQNDAKKYNGQIVQIDAVAKDATTVGNISVKAIRPLDKRIEIKDPKPYKNYQKAARLVKSGKDGVVLSNVRWGRKKEKDADGEPLFNWHKATIKPELIDKVYFVKKPFPPEWIAAHCLMLFTFKKGGFVDEKGNESSGLVLTIEALQRTDQKYSLQEGMKKTFGVVWILTSWEDYAIETCQFWGGKLIAYEVLFNQEQRKKLLHETIKQSVVNRSGEFYHTTRNNCTNNLLILMDKVANTKLKFWALPSMIYNVRATMPTMVPRYLQGKKLIGKELPTIDKTNFFAPPQQIFK